MGYFFNEPTKSNLTGEKTPNLVTLAPGTAFTKLYIRHNLRMALISLNVSPWQAFLE
jgi:hypothetical protein